MIGHHAGVIRDIDWLMSLLQDILIRSGEREWEDMKMKDYYEMEIVSMIEELKEQRRECSEKLDEVAF